MLPSKKIDLQRDFAVGVYLSEAQDPIPHGYQSLKQFSLLSLRMCSKPALLEGLEVDYYMWSWLLISQTVFNFIIAHVQQTGAAGGPGGGLLYVKLVINQSTNFFPNVIIAYVQQTGADGEPGGGLSYVELVIN
jgi:hypothetical protein